MRMFCNEGYKNIMRIAIDARMGHTRVGIGVYVRGLLNGLAKIDKINNYYIIINKNKKENFVPIQDNFHKIYTRVTYSDYLRRDFWEQAYLPLKLPKAKIDIYHGPNFTLPLFSRAKKIVTIYDMTLFITPEAYKRLSRFRVQWLLKLSAKKANKIIAGSENTKRDIIEILKLPNEKIKVIYIGIDDIYRPIADKYKLGNIKNKYKIDSKFILHVGSLQARKNIPRLIEAYSKLPMELLAKYQLVIAGKRSWKVEEILAKVKQLGLNDKVVFTGFVDDNDLPLLMNAANLLVFPSLYEGFGIPPLEAMACETPVVASNTSSIPEVVGDAALLFDPYNIKEMTKAINRALTDVKLRNKLRKRGFERIKQFSWEKAARETLQVYKEVYKNKIRRN